MNYGVFVLTTPLEYNEDIDLKKTNYGANIKDQWISNIWNLGEGIDAFFFAPPDTDDLSQLEFQFNFILNYDSQNSH
jgi:hypothetical protein